MDRNRPWLGLSSQSLWYDRRIGWLVLAIPVSCFGAAVLTFASFQQQYQADQRWVAHTLEVKLATELLNLRLLEAEVNAQSYGLTLEAPYLATYQTAVQELAKTQGRLLEQVRDNAEQYERLQGVGDLLVASIAALDYQLLSLSAADAYAMTAEELFVWLNQATDLLSLTREQIRTFAALESEYLQARQSRLEARYRWSQTSLYGLTALGVLAIAGAILMFNHQDSELRSRSRQLEIANEQLWRFAANASHELRAPLAAVLSNAQVGLMLLQDPAADPDTTATNQRDGLDCLNTVVTTTKRMSRLVSDLLQLARSQGGTLTLVPTNLTVLLHAWSERVQLQVPAAPVWIQADAGLLRQAFGTIIDNAERYARSEIRMVLCPEPVMITISDDGCGIAPEHLPHIFEPFYRASQQGEGCGLGLAIAKHVVEAHGGRIEVSSTVNEGTTFRVYLPRTSNAPRASV